MTIFQFFEVIVFFYIYFTQNIEKNNNKNNASSPLSHLIISLGPNPDLKLRNALFSSLFLFCCCWLYCLMSWVKREKNDDNAFRCCFYCYCCCFFFYQIFSLTITKNHLFKKKKTKKIVVFLWCCYANWLLKIVVIAKNYNLTETTTIWIIIKTWITRV